MQSFFTLSLLLMVLVGLNPNASATLGQKEVTVVADMKALSTSRHESDTSSPYFTVHEIKNDGGIVKEYASKADGIVFALTWKGINHPDLGPLLGAHFEAYKQALKAGSPRKMRSARRTIQSGSLIVEKFGHMGALQGRAYLTTLIPTGVSENDIK